MSKKSDAQYPESVTKLAELLIALGYPDPLSREYKELPKKEDTIEKPEPPPARTFYESCAKHARCQSADMAQTAFLQSIAFSLATIADAKTFLVAESYKPEKKEA